MAQAQATKQALMLTSDEAKAVQDCMCALNNVYAEGAAVMQGGKVMVAWSEHGVRIAPDSIAAAVGEGVEFYKSQQEFFQAYGIDD